MIAVEVLGAIENLLREKLKKGPDFVLADYFDFVAGTSTGAIIAACISLGMKVDTIRDFYISSGRDMFDKASLLKRFRYKYEDDKLAEKMQGIFGKDTTLGSEKLRTVLMMVMRNATTDSPWPLSNNPFAKYNRPERREEPHYDCNLDFPLWQLVRASTAAPVYFPPEVIKMGPNEFVFVDGGITTYTTQPSRLFSWPRSAIQIELACRRDKLLVVSIGTGTSPKPMRISDPSDMNLFITPVNSFCAYVCRVK